MLYSLSHRKKLNKKNRNHQELKANNSSSGIQQENGSQGNKRSLTYNRKLKNALFNIPSQGIKLRKRPYITRNKGPIIHHNIFTREMAYHK